MGAYKATQAYKLTDNNTWYKEMINTQKKYMEQRSKNEPSEKEKALIPKAGLKAVKRSVVELKRRLKYVFAEEPSVSSLYRIQWWLVLKLMVETPMRNDWPTLRVSGTTGNRLEKAKSGYQIIMTEYKNSNRLGPREIKVSRAGGMAIKKFLTMRKKVAIEHDFLMSNRQGHPLSKGGFSKALQKTTSVLLGKRIGSRIIRILFASFNQKLIKDAAQVTDSLLHTAKQTAQYIRN